MVRDGNSQSIATKIYASNVVSLCLLQKQEGKLFLWEKNMVKTLDGSYG